MSKKTEMMNYFLAYLKAEDNKQHKIITDKKGTERKVWYKPEEPKREQLKEDNKFDLAGFLYNTGEAEDQKEDVDNSTVQSGDSRKQHKKHKQNEISQHIKQNRKPDQKYDLVGYERKKLE